jgi:hypothetical protein
MKALQFLAFPASRGLGPRSHAMRRRSPLRGVPTIGGSWTTTPIRHDRSRSDPVRAPKPDRKWTSRCTTLATPHDVEYTSDRSTTPTRPRMAGAGGRRTFVSYVRNVSVDLCFTPEISASSATGPWQDLPLHSGGHTGWGAFSSSAPELGAQIAPPVPGGGKYTLRSKRGN